ncbi:MAG: aminopeptidase P family protein [Deltaproteobacteria bacterium]|nr:aminopeptidase P family protein [Deltaproteobacteria bacterium]
MAVAKFIYDTSERSADLFYATRFTVHDPIIFFEWRGKSYLVLNDLEIDRGKREAKVDRVLPFASYLKKLQAKGAKPRLIDILHRVFSDFHIRRLQVPRSTSFALVDALRKKGYRVEAGPDPFFPERSVKTVSEVSAIEASQRVTFAAIDHARTLLQRSRVRRGRIVYRNAVLTSERLREYISVFLLEHGMNAVNPPIVSCGIQSCDGHEIGHGPLKPHQSIVMDVFPRSLKTFYFGDATRTFCKGRAPDALKRLFATVREGEKLGLQMVRAGRNGRVIHEAIVTFFEKNGFPTGEKEGRIQGFMHGTGHAIGLEVHEEPSRINRYDCTLKRGMVMTVEPGLYYSAIGGVRLEDIAVVNRSGCTVLAHYPKELEIR